MEKIDEYQTDLVKNIDALITEFIEDKYKSIIPKSEFILVDENNFDDLDDKEEIIRTYPTLYIKLPLEQ